MIYAHHMPDVIEKLVGQVDIRLTRGKLTVTILILIEPASMRHPSPWSLR